VKLKSRSLVKYSGLLVLVTASMRQYRKRERDGAFIRFTASQVDEPRPAAAEDVRVACIESERVK